MQSGSLKIEKSMSGLLRSTFSFKLKSQGMISGIGTGAGKEGVAVAGVGGAMAGVGGATAGVGGATARVGFDCAESGAGR